MTHLPKLRLLYSSLKYPIHRNNNFSCYRLFGSGESGRKSPVTVKKKVEAALLEYLLCTRTLNFTDAEHMSKNSPHFVKKLIEKVGNESDDVKRSVAHFLNYHPINEFEPYFESIGLEASEFDAFLPRNLMFLSDEDGLLDNYHVLCKYGIARVQMGKIYREAREVFRYDKGVLQSKLLGFEQVGMRKDFVSRDVRFNPCILINGINEEFLKLVSKLKCLGFENSLFEQKFFETTNQSLVTVVTVFGLSSMSRDSI